MKTLCRRIAIVSILLPLEVCFAAGARSRAMIDRMIEEHRDPSRISARTIEAEQSRFESQVLRLMRRRSGMSARELDMAHLREYVAKNQSHPQNLDALAEILESITARGNVIPAEQEASANLLAKTLRMSERGGFSLEARDLIQIDRNWHAMEKDNLADILTEARALIEDNPTLTPDKAFEQALANRGLLQEFNKRCR